MGTETACSYRRDNCWECFWLGCKGSCQVRCACVVGCRNVLISSTINRLFWLFLLSEYEDYIFLNSMDRACATDFRCHVTSLAGRALFSHQNISKRPWRPPGPSFSFKQLTRFLHSLMSANVFSRLMEGGHLDFESAMKKLQGKIYKWCCLFS